MSDAEIDPRVAMAQRLAKFKHDPLGFVRFAWRWGAADTELSQESGPRDWQAEILIDIGRRLKAGEKLEPILESIASGHGIGKSALVAWIVLWAMSTRVDTKAVVTANTEAQLRTKTWPELAKWHRMMLHADWFTFTATSIYSADPRHEKTWRADAIPWSDSNTEAFAGLHNKGKRVLLVFDEASAISDTVWEVAEGALTDEDTEIIWCAFGNPTRNTGRFRECFGRFAHRWTHQQIDSRTVPGTNKIQIDKWIADYGEDSDFVRVRVKGMFPRAGSMQFIASDIVEAAATRESVSTPADPLVMSVDVARFGEDESRIGFRRGRDARSIPAETLRGVDTMTLAARAAELAIKYHPDAIFIDETGVGGGVVDRMRQLGFVVIGVNNGARADAQPEGDMVANKGAECYAKMRQWLRDGGAIENDPDLRSQLESREYGYNANNQIVLEKKDDMKKRGLSSPDRADQLALTFAYPVAPRTIEYDATLEQFIRVNGHQARALHDYDPIAEMLR